MNSTCLLFPPATAPRWLPAGPSGSASTSGSMSLVLRKEPPRWRAIARAVLPEGRGVGSSSPWDEKPFEVLPGGKIAYLDEQDIVALLDPPKELVPLDPSSYNPAAYLWKKIGDISEERRHHLLYVLNSRLISRLWQLVGARYEDAKLMKRNASNLLSMENTEVSSESWHCRKSLGPSIFMGITNSFGPLYFTVREVNEVMSTEQPSDLAYEFGDGLLDPTVIPDGFPRPAKHPWPFNDQLVIYIRQAGPGVLVGQAWQEGRELEKVPKKFCGEILMVKEYNVRQGGA
ncbi:hypothetical protein Taro_029199 [Colocasia esculenta]|uniref:Uncharacterized protein n=1 Tax=Colocasia esculenta TaxID=4460 RepID=A0A843VKL8_COLES|nr:hypothetical protein [Colocasia esculenta]